MQIHSASRLAAALVACVSLTSSAVAADTVNTLRWKALSEAGTYGYLIYRADQPTGPFKRINARLIQTQADASGEYTFGDADVVAGRTYYYRIDAVNDQGTKKSLSPVLPKVAGGKQAVSDIKRKGTS